MLCATIRSIKPGSFDDFRREWEPKPWPAKLRRVLISRNEQDPDQVLTASFIDIRPDQFDAPRDDPGLLGAEEARLSRIAGYEEALVYKGIFEVVEELSAPRRASRRGTARVAPRHAVAGQPARRATDPAEEVEHDPRMGHVLLDGVADEHRLVRWLRGEPREHGSMPAAVIA